MSKDQSELLGEIVTWDVRNVFIERDIFIQALESQGIEKARVKNARPRTFVKRALASAITGGLFRLIVDNEDRVSYAIVSEEVDANASTWSGRQQEGVIFNKKDGSLSFTQNSPIADTVRRLVASKKSALVSQDVGATIGFCLRSMFNAVSLRQQGGIFFVPNSRKADVDRLDAVLAALRENLGESSAVTVRLNRLGVVRSDAETETILRHVSDMVKEEVSTLRQEAVDKLADSSSLPSSFRERMSRLAAIIDKVTEYETVLQCTMVEQHKQLKNTRTMLKQCLLKKIQQRAAKER